MKNRLMDNLVQLLTLLLIVISICFESSSSFLIRNDGWRSIATTHGIRSARRDVVIQQMSSRSSVETRRLKPNQPEEDNDDDEEEDEDQSTDDRGFVFDKIAISGFADHKNNFASLLPFDFFHEHPAFGRSLVCITDDAKFVRKRFSSPKTVYNGFIDSLEIKEVKSMEDHKAALEGVDAWLAFNLSSSSLREYANFAIQKKIQRVLFAIAVNDSEYGPNIDYPEITSLLNEHAINYTLLKFYPPSNAREGPYRIVRGKTELPVPGEWNHYRTLSPKELFEIVAFMLPLPESYNQVLGIGVGGVLDENAMVQMRSQGWPRPVQLAQFLHVFMEDVERDVLEKLVQEDIKGEMETIKKDVKKSLPVKSGQKA